MTVTESLPLLHTTSRTTLLAVILAGGPAVLGSYAFGAMHPPENGSIWGGIPQSLQPLYTVSMLCATIGFFPFTWLLLGRTSPATARVGAFGYGFFSLCYALVMICSAAWLPLTTQLIDAPSASAWLAVRAVLFGAALGSLGILFGIWQLEPRATSRTRIAALVGCALFCWQTVVLDALVWAAYFPR